MPSAMPTGRQRRQARNGGTTSLKFLPWPREPMPGCSAGRRGKAKEGSPALHEELFRFAVGVEPGHELAVAVVEQGRDALVAAQRLLRRLAPARMRHLRVHVGPEAVLARLQLLPERGRPLVAELDRDDRF